jgi:hypothetical protein
MSVSSNDLSHELTVMADVLSDLGERLIDAARRLQSPGTPPSETLIEELSSCRRDFAHLRDRTRGLAESLHVAAPPDEALNSLQDLSALLDEIAEGEIRQSQSEELRRRALSILDRVLLLSHVAESEFPALRACHDQARALLGPIAEASWTALPAEAGPLAEGEHAFAHLLTLVEDRDELGDDAWADMHDSVATAFGKPLAAAAARAKIALPLEHAAAVGAD